LSSRAKIGASRAAPLRERLGSTRIPDDGREAGVAHPPHQVDVQVVGDARTRRLPQVLTPTLRPRRIGLGNAIWPGASAQELGESGSVRPA
jgi:hypothetical protein